VLAATLFVAIYNFVYYTREQRIADKIAKGINAISQKHEKKILRLRYRQYYKSIKKSKNYIEELDIKIEKANARNHIKILTAETLIIFNIILAIPAFILAYKLFYNVIAALLISSCVFSIPIIILNIQGYKNAAKVDTQLVYYINILKNFCHIQDDIIFAIERSIPYLREPLKSYNICLVNEVKHGISPYDAFENYKNKVGNKRFKLLIKNLQLCIKYKGRYVEVLTKSKDVLKKYSIEKNRRKTESKNARFVIYAMVLVSIGIFYGVVVINPFLLIELRKDLIGQLIIIYNIAVYVYALYKSITIEKFEY
jgi:tight adherence protein B